MSLDAPPGEGVRPNLFLMANTLETGGGERQFMILAQALRSMPWQLHLGCLRKLGAFSEGLEDIEEFPPGGSLFKFRAQRARLKLAHHLRTKRATIAHAFDFYSNLMMIPSARLASVPIVIGSQRQLGDLISPFRNKVQNAVFRWCDRVVCNSRAAAACLQNAGLKTSKLVVIPNALPDAAFAEAAPALPSIPDVMRVVMIARMNDPAKRHDVFLQGAALLAGKHPKLQFVLVGDGELRPGLQRMAADLGIASQTAFLGERHDIRDVLASSAISVLPSISESLSNSIMESMAAGVPAVACKVGGNEELIEDGVNGFLVPPGNATELAERIDRLVRQPELRSTFGARAQKDAERFRLDKVIRQYEQFYMSLLEEKGIRHPDLVLSRD